MLFAATIQIGGQLVPVKLRNLSQEGALVEADRLPSEGDTTYFERNDLRLKAQVVWVQGRYAGVAFDERLKPEQVLRHVPKPKARSQVRFMRPCLACRPLTDYERRMVKRWMSLLG
ncbi:MAG: PilZ domain-containing protein [Sphingomonas sp.]|nr:PilZ domain-containing protein [Sphingomonas sp.]